MSVKKSTTKEVEFIDGPRNLKIRATRGTLTIVVANYGDDRAGIPDKRASFTFSSPDESEEFFAEIAAVRELSAFNE